MKRVRFAEEEAMDDDDSRGDGIAADVDHLDPYADIRAAEAPCPPPPPRAAAQTAASNKAFIPLEPFNMASERREGIVDARGNLIPFDERSQRSSGSRKRRGEREREGDAWVDGLEEEEEEQEEEEQPEEDEVAGEMEGVPAAAAAALPGQQRQQRRRKKAGSSSSSSEDDSDDESDDEMTNSSLAEAAPLSGAELRALKLRLARLLRPEETVLAALRRLANPAGIAGSPASTGGLLSLASGGGGGAAYSSSSAAAAAAAATAADAAAAALSSSPMLRDSIVETGFGTGSGSGHLLHLPPRQPLPSQPPPRSRGRIVPAPNLPAFEEVTGLAAALAAAGESRVHWAPRESLLEGAGVPSSLAPPAAALAAFAAVAAVSGRKRRGEDDEGEEESASASSSSRAAAAVAEAAAAAVAEAAAAAAAVINAPGLVINGVQTDYKLVPSSEGAAIVAGSGGAGGGGDGQRRAPSSGCGEGGGPLYYSSSRGLYLSAAAVAAATTISSPPRVRCAATGAWKRARPVTDDGGKSGS